MYISGLSHLIFHNKHLLTALFLGVGIFVVLLFLYTAMIDVLLSRFYAGKTYAPQEMLLEKEYVHIPESDTLLVYILPWHGEKDEASTIKEKAQDRSYASLGYDMAPRVLSANVEGTLQNFTAIKEEISIDIEKYVTTHAFSRVILIGISLGSVPATMVAHGNEHVTDLILVAPGDDLAHSAWDGVRTQDIRKELEAQGVTLESLRNAWRTLAPKNNLEQLQGKKLTLYLSKSDRVVPYERGAQLAEAMHKQGFSPVVHTNRFLGHYLTIFKFYKFPQI